MLRSITRYVWSVLVPAAGAAGAWYALTSQLPQWQQAYLVLSGIVLTVLVVTEMLAPFLTGPKPFHSGSLHLIPLMAAAINVAAAAKSTDSLWVWAGLGTGIAVLLIAVAINRMSPIEGDPHEYRDMGRTPSRDRT